MQYVALIAFSLIFGLILLRRKPKGGSYPPGPKGDPIIGHVRIMPLEEQWKVWGQWGKQFGDMIYAKIFAQDIVIINSPSVARDLLDKRSSIYSDRPRLETMGLMGLTDVLPFMRYGDRWRKQRRMSQQYMDMKTILEYIPVKQHYSMILLNDLLNEPNRFKHHINRSIASQVVMVTYGYPVKRENDRFVELIEKTLAMMVEYGTPGTTAVDLFPWLLYIPSWMPGAGFKRHGLKTAAVVDETMGHLFEWVKKQRINGTARKSIVEDLLKDAENKGIDDPEHFENIKYVAGITYIAGVETSVDSILSFILAMILYPRVAKRAQEELDKAVGNDRLPELSDRKNLPYLDCIYKETLRWCPPLPLGLTHRVTEDDHYMGYRIPAGATIISNIWQMTHDEKHYKDPEAFIPERFEVKKDGSEPYDSTSTVFGFGRRVCSGRHYADNAVWLTIAYILATFDILPPLDKDGKEYLPEAKFSVLFTCQPVDFSCRTVPRSEKARELIRRNVPNEL